MPKRTFEGEIAKYLAALGICHLDSPTYQKGRDCRNGLVIPVSPFGLAVLRTVKASRVAFHFVPLRGSRTHDYVARPKYLAIPIRKKHPQGVLFSYRNSEIRTHDLLLPKQALYQAELYSGLVGTIIDKNRGLLKGSGAKNLKNCPIFTFFVRFLRAFWGRSVRAGRFWRVSRGL